MIPALKAEFRKLFTTRTTYVILAIAFLVTCLFSGYAMGFRLNDVAAQDPSILQSSLIMALQFSTIFIGLIGVLLVTQEYRFNTILYSLTANRSRSVFLLAKIITMTVVALVATVVIGLLAVLVTVIGSKLGGTSLAVQHFYFSDFGWRVLFHVWGYAMLAVIIAFLVRHQIGAIMALFIVPTTVEGILSIVMKDNAAYLPFTALDSVLEKSAVLNYPQAALVFSGYLVVGFIATWLLFKKRDAN